MNSEDESNGMLDYSHDYDNAAAVFGGLQHNELDFE